MMSQIVMSTDTSRPGRTSCSSTDAFDTFVPIVIRYRSSNMFSTYRWIRDVLPTPVSPTRHTFDFTVLSVFSGAEVDLVDRVHDGELAGDPEHGRDPLVELLERGVPREVAHREDAPAPLEVRVLEEVAEALLPHDVPHGHVDLHAPVLRRDLEDELLLAHLRAQRGHVPVLEFVEHEAAHHGRLTDRSLAHEAHLRLHPLRAGRHGRAREPRPHKGSVAAVGPNKTVPVVCYGAPCGPIIGSPAAGASGGDPSLGGRREQTPISDAAH